MFRAASEWALNVLNIDDFFIQHSPSGSHLLHTRHLKIDAPIHLTRFNRCAAFNIFRAVGLAADPFSTIGTPDDARAHEQFLEDIGDQLHLVFARLSPNHLRSFTCVACHPTSWILIAVLIGHQMALGHMPSSRCVGSRGVSNPTSGNSGPSFVGHRWLLPACRWSSGWSVPTVFPRGHRMGRYPAFD